MVVWDCGSAVIQGISKLEIEFQCPLGFPIDPLPANPLNPIRIHLPPREKRRKTNHVPFHLLQNLKNQIMTTNVWVEQVSH